MDCQDHLNYSKFFMKLNFIFEIVSFRLKYMLNKNNSGQAKYKNITSSNTIYSLINMCRERNRAEDNIFWMHPIAMISDIITQKKWRIKPLKKLMEKNRTNWKRVGEQAMRNFNIEPRGQEGNKNSGEKMLKKLQSHKIKMLISW